MVRLSKPLYLSSPIVGVAAALVLGVGIFFMVKEDVPSSWPYLILGGVGLLYTGGLALVFYYKMWESIQDGYARTSPGKAVGFMFIPFFNLYWIFQAIWGFSKDYNAYVDRYAINTRKLPEGLFLAFSVLPLTAWIPFFGIAASAVQLILFVIIVSLVCDAVNALPPLQGEIIAPPVLEMRASGGEAAPLRRLPARPLSLYCLSGEFAHETIMVPDDGISIGRDPTRVNLVLSASEVSGVHARVQPEPKSAKIWLEDLRSLNGTFYCQQSAGGRGGSGWLPLQGKILLSPGARFRLAVDGPAFEIRES